MEYSFIQNCYRFFEMLLCTHVPHLHALFVHHNVADYDFLIPWFTSFFLRDFSPEIAIMALNGFVVDGPPFLFVAALALLSFLFPEITPTTFADLMYGNLIVKSSGPLPSPSPSSRLASGGSAGGSIMDFEAFTLRLAGVNKRGKSGGGGTGNNISLDMFIARVRLFGGKGVGNTETHSILDKFSDFFVGFL
jgi:hypothetical protein